MSDEQDRDARFGERLIEAYREAGFAAIEPTLAERLLDTSDSR